MKPLIFVIAFLGFSFNPFSFNTSIVDGIDSVVIQCGEDPDGNWDCVRYELDDGSDCLIIVNEGSDTIFDGC